MKPCIESKVFGIGVEAYTAGSAEFALSYAAFNKDKCIPLMDNGHYHPTEVVSDKIPALLQPAAEEKKLQDGGNFTKLMVLQDELKTAPFGEVWDEYCRQCGVPADGQWLPLVEQYEADVLSKRG